VRALLDSVGTAFSYFSIFPVRGAQRLPAPDAAALAALPLVGAALGGLAGGAAWLVSRVAPRPLAVATAYALPIVLSGALHIDGFLDCSDAVFASVSPQRRLEILKDPAHGTFALAALAIVSAYSIAALTALPAARFPGVLAYAGALARLATVWNARCFPYARTAARTRAFEARPSLLLLALQSLVLGVASFRLSRSTWALVPLCCIAARFAAAGLAKRLGGGLVGDAYGFLIVVLESAIVVVLATRRDAS